MTSFTQITLTAIGIILALLSSPDATQSEVCHIWDSWSPLDQAGVFTSYGTSFYQGRLLFYQVIQASDEILVNGPVHFAFVMKANSMPLSYVGIWIVMVFACYRILQVMKIRANEL